MPTDNIKELMQKPLVATGEVTLTAAPAEDGKAAPNGNKKITINAYNGGIITVGWYGKVGIELSGLSWRDDAQIPILYGHDNELDSICGQSSRIYHDGRSLTVEGSFMPVSENAKKVLELSQSGYKFQASVGVSPSDMHWLDEGQSYTLNGAEVQGPCYIVRAGTFNEISIVPIGADGTTKTAISAAATNQGKEGAMPKDNKPVEAEKPDTANIEAAQKAERERTAAVITACKGHDDIMARAVKEGWTPERAELECLRAEKVANDKAKIEAARPAAPSVIDLKAAAPKDAATVTAAACMGAAMSDADVEAAFKGTGVDLNAAHDLRVSRLSDIFAAFGCEYRPGDDASMTKAIRAAFSTADIPNVLSNVAHKFVMRGFGAVGEEWRQVSRAVPVTDFKAVKGVRLLMGGLLKPLAKGGELQHVSLSDEARNIQAATKGSIVGITREDLINDDLGVLSEIPAMFGQMAGRTINKDVFDLIAGLSGSAFGASTTGALSVANLSAAYALAMGIKDAAGDPLGAMPNTILVSPANIVTARNIYQSAEITGATAKEGKNNPLRSLFNPVVSPYLTGTAYWLFNSAFPLVDIAFLNGRQTPVVETANVDFNQLGIQMRCYYDFGVSAGDVKAALYSTGA